MARNPRRHPALPCRVVRHPHARPGGLHRPRVTRHRPTATAPRMPIGRRAGKLPGRQAEPPMQRGVGARQGLGRVPCGSTVRRRGREQVRFIAHRPHRGGLAVCSPGLCGESGGCEEGPVPHLVDREARSARHGEPRPGVSRLPGPSFVFHSTTRIADAPGPKDPEAGGPPSSFPPIAHRLAPACPSPGRKTLIEECLRL